MKQFWKWTKRIIYILLFPFGGWIHWLIKHGDSFDPGEERHVMFSKVEMNERSERLKKYIKLKDKEEYKELLASGKISSFNEFYEYKERQANPNFNKEQDLERLNLLLDEGYLTQEEYEKLK